MKQHYTGLIRSLFLPAVLASGLASAQVTNPSECGLGLAIPDNGCGTNQSLTVPITVSGFNNQLGVNAYLLNVELIITHTWRDDLRVYLTAPGGTEQPLMLERGGSSENFGNSANCPESTLVFQDGAAQLNTMGGGNNITGTFAPEQPLANFTGNPNGTWQLRICDSAGEDVGTLEYVSLGLSNELVGVEEREALHAMQLWPNPVAEQLTISLASPVAGTLEYQVFDALGRVVITGNRPLAMGPQQFPLDVAALPAGQYSTRFLLNGEVVVQRFVKH
jgi:subtilisin-like proprotein convertase family protein